MDNSSSYPVTPSFPKNITVTQQVDSLSSNCDFISG